MEIKSRVARCWWSRGSYRVCLASLTIVLLSSCRPPSPPLSTPTVSPALSPQPMPSTTEILLPIRHIEYSSLDKLQAEAPFPLYLPGYLPPEVSFYKAWVSEYANGDQNVRILYEEPGDPRYALLKAVDIQMRLTESILSLDSLLNQPKANPLDILEVTVRGHQGFTYWQRSVAMGNWATLAWRENTINFTISLYGDWPFPSEDNPHILDPLLLRIAESLEAER